MVRARGVRVLLPGLALAWLAAAVTPPVVTSPKDALGFNLGDDYQVANYTQLETYWKKLAAESDRMKLVDIGTTGEGRRQYMAIVSSPANLKNLDRYKDIARGSRLPKGSRTNKPTRWRGKAKRWSGSTAACTQMRPSARSS